MRGGAWMGKIETYRESIVSVNQILPMNRRGLGFLTLYSSSSMVVPAVFGLRDDPPYRLPFRTC